MLICPPPPPASALSPSPWFRGGLRAAVLGSLLALMVGLPGDTSAAEANPSPSTQDLAALSGQPLAAALTALQRYGIEVVFTDAVVTPSMRVEKAPRSGSAKKILQRLLSPHGLTARPSAGGRWVVVSAPKRARRAVAKPEPSPGRETIREEITVTRERPAGGDTGTTLTLNGEVLEGLPHPGGDVFRALTLLPGTSAANELSAQINVRGGREDEVQVVLDGLELFEPYHLQDFGGATSVVAEEALGDVALITGTLPAEYGDRMSAVLELTTRSGAAERRGWLGASVTEAIAGASGNLHQGRQRWLASLRQSIVPRATRVVLGEVRNPLYADLLGRLDATLNPAHEIQVHTLLTRDGLDFERPGGTPESTDPTDPRRGANTRYASAYLWLRHQGLLGPNLLVQSVASAGWLDRDRQGFEGTPGTGVATGFALDDRRDLNFVGLAQDWSWQRTAHHTVSWGFSGRRLRTRYNYFNRRDLTDPLAAIRHQSPLGETTLEERFQGEQLALYGSEQRRLWGRLTLESGLRFDENELTEDNHLSPRLAAVLDLGQGRALRASWGYLYQSQRPYELQVEDGEKQFFTAERSEHAALGYEHGFDRSGLSLRIDAYRRKVTLPRPRFENLFDPLTVFPELESDRIRITPQRSIAQGVEILLRGAVGHRIDWWLSYGYAETLDEIDHRRVRRAIDQPHTVRFDLNIRPARAWNLNFAWRYHTGWPTTAITFETTEEGTLTPILGALNDERLPAFHRLDTRLSWRRPLRKGELTLFLDLENLYGRDNVRGFTFTYTGGDAVRHEVGWGDFFASVGGRWRF